MRCIIGTVMPTHTHTNHFSVRLSVDLVCIVRVSYIKSIWRAHIDSISKLKHEFYRKTGVDRIAFIRMTFLQVDLSMV